MGLEERFNKRLIGAVMGGGYIEKPKKSVSEEDATKKTKKLEPLKDFLELGVWELHHTVHTTVDHVKKEVKSKPPLFKKPKNIFKKPKKTEDEDEER